MSVEMFGLTPKSLRKQRLYAKTFALVLKKKMKKMKKMKNRIPLETFEKYQNKINYHMQ